ncbi:MAG: hypothetical protein N2C14_07835, partial [Planctomycetales bacterium]
MEKTSGRHLLFRNDSARLFPVFLAVFTALASLGLWGATWEKECAGARRAGFDKRNAGLQTP